MYVKYVILFLFVSLPVFAETRDSVRLNPTNPAQSENDIRDKAHRFTLSPLELAKIRQENLKVCIQKLGIEKCSHIARMQDAQTRHDNQSIQPRIEIKRENIAQ